MQCEAENDRMAEANGRTVLMQVPEEDFAEFIRSHNTEAMATSP